MVNGQQLLHSRRNQCISDCEREKVYAFVSIVRCIRVVLRYHVHALLLLCMVHTDHHHQRVPMMDNQGYCMVMVDVVAWGDTPIRIAPPSQ